MSLRVTHPYLHVSLDLNLYVSKFLDAQEIHVFLICLSPHLICPCT